MLENASQSNACNFDTSQGRTSQCVGWPVSPVHTEKTVKDLRLKQGFKTGMNYGS